MNTFMITLNRISHTVLVGIRIKCAEIQAEVHGSTLSNKEVKDMSYPLNLHIPISMTNDYPSCHSCLTKEWAEIELKTN